MFNDILDTEVITQLLSTAVKLYLRSQVSQLEDLQVKISGTNRQILKGYIPQVFLSCQRGAYHGLYLREVEVNGTDIAINLPEVLKKKPLKLVDPIVVTVKLGLDANDLKASLDSPLLQSGLRDLWQIILSSQEITPISSPAANSSIDWNNIAIAEETLHLSGIYRDYDGRDRELHLSTDITLANSHTLCLSALKITDEFKIVGDLGEKVEIDLGTDIAIKQLVIESKQILCLGDITVNS